MFLNATIFFLITSLILFNITPSGWFHHKYFYPILISGYLASLLYNYFTALYIYIVLKTSINGEERGFIDTVKYFINHFFDLKLYFTILIIYIALSIAAISYVLTMEHIDLFLYYTIPTIMFILSFIIEYLIRPYMVFNELKHRPINLKHVIIEYTIPWFIIALITATTINAIIYFITSTKTSLYPYFWGFDEKALDLIRQGYTVTWIPTYGEWFSTILITLYSKLLISRRV